MNKQLHKIIASAVLLFIVCSSATATTHGVAVSLINYTFDTVGYDYTITINARVSNYDSVPFNGVIDFGLRNDHYNLSTTNVFNKPPYSANQISLYAYESVPAVFSVHIDPQYFSPGPDVVVVWPICTQPIVDSIVIDIFVQIASGVKEDKEEMFGFILTNDRIFIKNTDAQTNFKQVRIYNLLGQQVSELHSEFITEVPLPVVPKGIYLAEFIAADGKQKVIRFFH